MTSDLSGLRERVAAEISALRAAAAEATPGAWFIVDGRPLSVMAPDGDDSPWEIAVAAEECSGITYDDSPANARYIALANPQTVTALLDQLDAARARVVRLDKCLRDVVADELGDNWSARARALLNERAE